MDMIEALATAAAHADETGKFDTRHAFGKRAGKMIIFPVGLGSAFAKAVREGYLVVVTEGSRRRGRTYAFTPTGRNLVPRTG